MGSGEQTRSTERKAESKSSRMCGERAVCPSVPFLAPGTDGQQTDCHPALPSAMPPCLLHLTTKMAHGFPKTLDGNSTGYARPVALCNMPAPSLGAPKHPRFWTPGFKPTRFYHPLGYVNLLRVTEIEETTYSSSKRTRDRMSPKKRDFWPSLGRF